MSYTESLHESPSLEDFQEGLKHFLSPPQAQHDVTPAVSVLSSDFTPLDDSQPSVHKLEGESLDFAQSILLGVHF